MPKLPQPHEIANMERSLACIPNTQGLDRQTSEQVLEWLCLALADLAQLKARSR